MSKAAPHITFMGIKLFGRDVGGPRESWSTRNEDDAYPMMSVAKSMNGTWFVVITFRSRGLQLGSAHPSSNAPTRRAALARLKKRIQQAREDLAVLEGK